MPLREAAAVLGVSKDAVRQRVRRDTLRSDKGEDGRVYVYLDASVDDVHGSPAEAGDDPLYREMQARIAYLEGQVAEEREARRRADTLLARLMDRVPELPAPQETLSDAPGPPETGSEGSGGTPRPDAPGPHSEATSAQRRPWWRRVLGG